MSQPRIIPRSEHPISRRQIDPDALKVLYRLQRHGRIAYVVGGGVRDLLLGQQPKDFDVVTDAHPGEVKRLFRNSWIVGRRFRLVHVVFGRKIVEVATFRRQAEVVEPEELPESAAGAELAEGEEEPAPPRAPRGTEDLLITQENTFGTPEEDARRRDFTINALFYDISTYALIDYIGGLEDLENRIIRTIGDPDIRFQEDPVRMMRAVKFAARLGFRLDPQTRAAMQRQAATILRSAPPRVLEEIYRLLGSGRAQASFHLLAETGLLTHLLPEVGVDGAAPQDAVGRHLEELDAMVATDGSVVSRAVQMAALVAPVIDTLGEAADAGEPSPEIVERFLRPLALRLRVTRADTARMLQMFQAQRQFARAHGRRFSPLAFMRRTSFEDSFRLFTIRARASGRHRDDVRVWVQRLRSVVASGGMIGGGGASAPAGERPRRRRRRRLRSPLP